MAVSLHELLMPQVIINVISRLREGQGRLGRWLGFQPNRFDPATVSLSGPNTRQGDTRYVTYRIDDATRIVATGRAPGTGPGTVPRQPVGDTTVACARFHEKVPLYYEELGNLSPLMGPNSQVDPGGQDYVMRQERKIALKFNNAVELMSTGMMQDSLYFQQSGDNWLPVIGQPATGVFFQVNFQVPAGNKNQVNMLGTGNIITLTWNNPAALIFGMISSLKAATAQLSGYPLMDIWCNSLLWYNVISNTEIRNLAGSSATPFAEYDWSPENGADGMPTGEYTAVLKADPTIRWHINDHVVVTGGFIDPTWGTAPAGTTITKIVPDGTIFACTEPSPLWCEMYHGGEYVVENPGMPGVLRRGYYFWREYCTQPSMMELIGLMNAVPVLYNPRVVIPAKVIF